MPAKLTTGLELILCACEKELFVILTDNDELVCAHVWAMQDHATEILAPDLKQILELSGHSVSDIRRIGCVRGPGSFTGTRLVLATAAALRRGVMHSLPPGLYGGTGNNSSPCKGSPLWRAYLDTDACPQKPCACHAFLKLWSCHAAGTSTGSTAHELF